MTNVFWWIKKVNVYKYKIDLISVDLKELNWECATCIGSINYMLNQKLISLNLNKKWLFQRNIKRSPNISSSEYQW